LDANLRSGSAEWLDFPELRAEAKSDAAELPADADGEVETEIRGLITEYNELLAERALEDLLEYHVENQQDTIAELYRAVFAVVDELADTQTAFDESLPDSADRVAELFGRLEGAAGAQLAVDALEVVNDEEVGGRLPAGAMTARCRFVIIDEEWYIEYPQLPQPAEVSARLDRITAAMSQWREALDAGERPAEEVLGEAERFLAEFTGDSGAASVEDEE
jgi:hypothetical protein